MFTASTGYEHFRYRPNGVAVEAVQLTIYNVKRVAQWIRDNGGATAGMLVVDQGELRRRGIWLGTLDGDVEGAGERDWLILSEHGFTVCPWDLFSSLYEPVPGKALLPERYSVATVI
jgi:hypothetical protein